VLALIFGIAQVSVILVTAPAIAWMWSAGDHGTLVNVLYTVLLIVAGMADNVLKPLLLGRGVDAPMPVVVLGALGGMATSGILGMFIGAIMLSIGCGHICRAPFDGSRSLKPLIGLTLRRGRFTHSERSARPS